ncbi:MAG: CsgG/HfaB family protein [Spirochaetota bacterium]
MIKKLFFLIFLMLFIRDFNFLKAEEKLKIALLDFTPENTQQTYARAVRNLFEVSLYKSGSFSILERNKMEMILKEQGFQMSGCTDTSCAVQIGKILSADMVVIGSLNKLGKYTVTAKFVNVKHGRVELADSETAETEDGIQNAVNALAGRMAGNITNKTEKIDAGTKSDDAKKDGSSSSKSAYPLNLAIAGAYLLPQARFADLVEAGYGATANFGIEDLFIRNSMIGIETGYWYFPGKKENVDYCSMIPVFINVGYRYNISHAFYVLPAINAGISYNTMNWDKDGSSSGTYKFKKENEIETIVKAVVGFGYMLNESLSIQIAAGYCIILEEKPLRFVIVSGGVGAKL